MKSGNPNPIATPAPSPADVASLVRLSDQLTTALRALIASAPFAGLGPIELARTLAVDKTTASRLMSALRASDPLAALSLLPGASPLRQFIRQAAIHGATPEAVAAAETELRAFDLELQRTFGTRTHLDAAIADSLPESRRRQQETARQSVYRGMALIKGVSIDLAGVTWVIRPAQEPGSSPEIIVLATYSGVRRLKPSARVRLGSRYDQTRPESGARLLRKFCSPTDLSIESTIEGNTRFYEIATGPIRRDAASDIVLTETLRTAQPVAAPLPFGDVIAQPYKRLLLNIIIQEGLWPGCDFACRVYDGAFRGHVKLPDPTRDSDILPVEAEVRRSRVGAESLRTIPIPRYTDLLETVCGSRANELQGARMFTCEIPYPPYSSSVMLVGA
jgi:hypothetical protein